MALPHRNRVVAPLMKKKTAPHVNKNAKIKALFKEQGVSQRALAERLDIAPGYISEILNGRRDYNQRILEGMADVLGMTPSEVLAEASEDRRRDALQQDMRAAKEKLLEIANEEDVSEAPIEFTLKLYTNLMTGGYSKETVRDLLLAYKAGLLKST